ncbi:MAG: methyltransferase domain-containing protein [Actinomycetota bacterium]|nr:methyltransferase domain-containing protein [Actinomycetota bacterium]
MSDIPVNRWELGGERHAGYAVRFAELIAQGADIDGEARLADVLVRREARILDAGSGMGRVAAALHRRGHLVTAVEKDPALIAQSRERFPEIPVVESDILGLSPAMLRKASLPTAYDLITVVGNVMILLAESTERRVLSTLGGLLDRDGRMLVGFRTSAGPGNSRDYSWTEFAADAAESGLVVQHRFGTYDLRPAIDDYVVAVLGSR